MTPCRPRPLNRRSSNLHLPLPPFVGRLYAPREVQERRPGLLIIGGSGGGMPWERARAAATAGVPSVAIAYFKAPGLPGSLKAISLEYFRDALEWLSGLQGVDPNRLVVMGISRGSEAALLTGVHFSGQVAAVVALAPGNVVLGSWPPGGPAWTLNGSPLRFVRVSDLTPRSEMRSSPSRASRPRSHSSVPGATKSGLRWQWRALLRTGVGAAGRQHQDDLLLEYTLAGHDVGAVAPGGGGTAAPSRTSEDNPRTDDAWPRLLQFIRAVPSRGSRD